LAGFLISKEHQSGGDSLLRQVRERRGLGVWVFAKRGKGAKRGSSGEVAGKPWCFKGAESAKEERISIVVTDKKKKWGRP